MAKLAVGLVQMRSGVEPQANLDAAVSAIRTAAGAGARLVLTPEATNLVQRDQDALRATAPDAASDPGLDQLAALARSLGIWLVVGSLMQKRADGQVVNRSYVFDDTGMCAAQYDKIHLFDVALGAGERYEESAVVAPGDTAVGCATPWGGLGLTICYDVRFAGLYADLARAGCDLIAVPAAFTRATGRAHWKTLLRARAIETGAFVLAPAQGGLHADGRKTWGHSMVIDPWGAVIASLEHDGPGVLLAELDLSLPAKARGRLPSLGHARGYRAPAPVGVSAREETAP